MSSQKETPDTATESSAGTPETQQPEVPQEVTALVEALRANPKPFFGNIAHEPA